MKKLLTGMSVLFVVSVSGCATRADEPPRIAYGRDVCAQCRMIINEDKYAAALVDESGTHEFDDIGCMKLFEAKTGAKVRRIWVKDARTAEWLDGSNTSFTVTPDLATPMGYGILAHPDAAPGGMPWQGLTSDRLKKEITT